MMGMRKQIVLAETVTLPVTILWKDAEQSGTRLCKEESGSKPEVAKVVRWHKIRCRCDEI